jgi:hypothetical protein
MRCAQHSRRPRIAHHSFTNAVTGYCTFTTSAFRVTWKLRVVGSLPFFETLLSTRLHPAILSDTAKECDTSLTSSYLICSEVVNSLAASEFHPS